MEGLSWNASPAVENLHILWSNIEQQELEASLNPSYPNNPMQEMQQNHYRYANSLGKELMKEMVQLSEAEAELVGANTISSKANLSQLIGGSSLVGGSYSMNNPFGNFYDLSTEFNMAHQQHTSQLVVNNNVSQNGTSTFSTESLDCLFSATNSNTDTSAEEDDGVSMILPTDCSRKRSSNLWSFSYNNNGGSESDQSTTNYNATNNADHNETLSQGSSDLHANQVRIKIAESTKTSNNNKCSKRRIVDDDAFNQYPYFSIEEGGAAGSSSFRIIEEKNKNTDNNPLNPKRPRWDSKLPTSSNINFKQPHSSSSTTTTTTSSSTMEEPDPDAIAQMKEMIYRAAAFRPVNLGMEMVEKPKRKNVKISSDPQTVAARLRRERISERIRVLQKLVPGGSKMDTASMLDEAANYLKFLRSQVKALESLGSKVEAMNNCPPTNIAFSFNPSFPMQFNPNSYHHIQQ